MAHGTPHYKTDCIVCGLQISNGGLARTSHYRKHVREGRMVEKDVSFDDPVYNRKRGQWLTRYRAALKFLPVRRISDFTNKAAIRLNEVGFVFVADTYHSNISKAARLLVEQGCRDWEYLTQYASGTTVWRNSDTGETRLVKGEPC